MNGLNQVFQELCEHLVGSLHALSLSANTHATNLVWLRAMKKWWHGQCSLLKQTVRHTNALFPAFKQGLNQVRTNKLVCACPSILCGVQMLPVRKSKILMNQFRLFRRHVKKVMSEPNGLA